MRRIKKMRYKKIHEKINGKTVVEGRSVLQWSKVLQLTQEERAQVKTF